MTAKLSADTSAAPLLSLIWPGLGQLYQGRLAHAAHFLVESGFLAVVIAVSERLRAAALLGFAALAVWSIVDAFRAERTRSDEMPTASSAPHNPRLE